MGDGIFINESMIAKYLYSRLIEDGYAPAADEVLDLAEYMFDYLVELDAIELDATEEDGEED